MATALLAATSLTLNLTRSVRPAICPVKIPSIRELSFAETTRFTPTDTRMRMPTSTTS